MNYYSLENDLKYSSQLGYDKINNLNTLSKDKSRICSKCVDENQIDGWYQLEDNKPNTKPTISDICFNHKLYNPLQKKDEFGMPYNLDGAMNPYFQYKPRRPKCPIIWNTLFKHENVRRDLISNPLYNSPISEENKQNEKQWMKTLTNYHINTIKSMDYLLYQKDEPWILDNYNNNQ